MVIEIYGLWTKPFLTILVNYDAIYCQFIQYVEITLGENKFCKVR